MCISDGGDFFVLPSKADIERRYKLVVTTLITAGRYVIQPQSTTTTNSEPALQEDLCEMILGGGKGYFREP